MIAPILRVLRRKIRQAVKSWWKLIRPVYAKAAWSNQKQNANGMSSFFKYKLRIQQWKLVSSESRYEKT